MLVSNGAFEHWQPAFLKDEFHKERPRCARICKMSYANLDKTSTFCALKIQSPPFPFYLMYMQTVLQILWGVFLSGEKYPFQIPTNLCSPFQVLINSFN